MMKSMVGIAASVLCVFSVAHADDSCAAPQTPIEMRICAGQQFAQADKALNEAYGVLVQLHKSQGNQSSVTQLATAEKAWIVFRDLECKYRGHADEGGHEQPVRVLACETSLTDKRTDDLIQDFAAFNLN